MPDNKGEKFPYESALSKAGQHIPVEIFQAIYKYVLDRKSGNIIISFAEGRISILKTENYTRFKS